MPSPPAEGHEGKLSVVLGAGNQSFLAVCDVLYMVFVEGCVAALKYHPIMAPVSGTSVLASSLESLDDKGGTDVAALAHHA
jgi:hypothetical protein